MRFKKYIAMIFIIISTTLFTGCSEEVTMDNVFEKDSFTATVAEPFTSSVLLKVDNDEYDIKDEYIKVSLDLKIEGSLKEFNEGDKVRVYYDGNIKDGHPAQIDNAYTIMLSKGK